MFLCLIYYGPINSGVICKIFLLVVCEIILWAGKKKHWFLKTGDNGTFDSLLKFIGLYYSQVWIHVKFIFYLLFLQWCVFHI